MTAQENANLVIDCLGLRIVSYALDIRKTKELLRIALGDQGATAIQTGRLDQMVDWVNVMRTKETDATIRALSIGSWPELDDRAPIELFHMGEGWRALNAARSYQ